MPVSDDGASRRAADKARDDLNKLVREPMTPPRGLVPETDFDSKGRYRGRRTELYGSPNDPTIKD